MARKQDGSISEIERIPVDELYFDAQNPRLVEYLEGKHPTQEDLLRVLWTEMGIDEVALSIASSGYFDYEPLIVAKEHSKWIVIEGNRRLAAVKLLLNSSTREKLKATDLPSLSKRIRDQLQTLPCVITDRKGAWQYLGFKHVNGPRKWDSYAKAQYVAEVCNTHGVPLEEIARTIGDKHQTVQRLYRALMVVQQAEKAGVFSRSDTYKSHFSFSHLYTGLDYEGFATYVGLREDKPDSPNPIPRSYLPYLGELCTWLYGSRSLDIRPVVESQNPHLRQLDEVLKNVKSVEALRAGLPLSVALEVSYGDERVFSNALINAKEQLQKARGTLSTGFTGQRDQLLLARSLADIAYDLVDEMERKVSTKRRRNTESEES